MVQAFKVWAKKKKMRGKITPDKEKPKKTGSKCYYIVRKAKKTY